MTTVNDGETYCPRVVLTGKTPCSTELTILIGLKILCQNSFLEVQITEGQTFQIEDPQKPSCDKEKSNVLRPVVGRLEGISDQLWHKLA